MGTSRNLANFLEEYNLYANRVDRDYILDICKEIPMIGHALQSLPDNDEIIGKLPRSVDRFQLAKVDTQREEIDDFFSDLSENLAFEDQDFKDIIATMFPKRPNIAIEGEKLKQTLVKNGYFEKFSELRDQNQIRMQKWMSSIIHMVSPLSLDLRRPVYRSDNAMHIIWPVLLYTYVRDFELFYRLFIHHAMQEKAVGSSTYLDKLEQYCPDDVIFSYLNSEVIVPDIRTRLIHQDYYIDLENSTICLLPTSGAVDQQELSVTFKQMGNYCSNLSLVLWLSIIYLYNFEPINSAIDNNEKLCEVKLFGKSYKLDFHDRMTAKIVPLMRALQGFNTKAAISQSEAEWAAGGPLKESFEMYEFFLLSKPPDLQMSVNIIFQQYYLVGYSLIKKRFILPIVKSMQQDAKSTRKIDYLPDRDLYQILNEYESGQFKSLFNGFNPPYRNAIAHVNYFMEHGQLHPHSMSHHHLRSE